MQIRCSYKRSEPFWHTMRKKVRRCGGLKTRTHRPIIYYTAVQIYVRLLEIKQLLTYRQRKRALCIIMNNKYATGKIIQIFFGIQTAYIIMKLVNSKIKTAVTFYFSTSSLRSPYRETQGLNEGLIREWDRTKRVVVVMEKKKVIIYIYIYMHIYLSIYILM